MSSVKALLGVFYFVSVVFDGVFCLDCLNVSASGTADSQINIRFPVSASISVHILSRASNGLLYEQIEVSSTSRVQGSLIETFPFTLVEMVQPGAYFRPYPQASGTPLSMFTFSLSTLTISGTEITSGICYVFINVEAFNNNPFSGGAGQALQFDGADDHVYAAVSLFPSSYLTVSMWLKSDSSR
eukprot:CAMPEP_0113712588 /NCGR_PEP_ID=MMETSP0038_2-20120614/31480_1 /TAXON_ID=2898 /ORGANISM="Cryptomonas paramecium" /LENGTH=184 /DNA_ID=CAMNT_0000639141 /DNA_START=10 /DNA_END=560 /DNA_ORIENTATION=+ /assembly_acc=CAM_ASM_000170